MDFQEKSKEELDKELNELQKKYNSIVDLNEKNSKERFQTEKILSENEANLKAIIENSLESIWSIDLNYRIKYINEVFANTFELTFGVRLVKGMNILDALPPQLRTIWKERYDRAFNNEHFVFNDKIELEQGDIFIEVAMSPVVIDNKVVGASFFGKDVSEEKKANQALLESEKRFKALHNASFGGIAIHDKGKIIDCNQRLSEITGYSFDELIGMDGLKLIAENYRGLVLKNISEGNEKPYEAVGLRKDDREFPVRVEARNIPYGGKTVRITEFRDITEQKLAEAAHWESQVNFKALFEKGPIGVAYHRMVYDKSGKPVDYYFLDANQSYQKMTGVNPVGKLVTEAFPGIENDPFKWFEIFGEVARNGKDVRIQQYFQITDKWYDIVAYQYKQDHFVAAFFDITEQKHAEIALKERDEIFRHFMENSPIYVFFKDKQIRALQLSNNFEQMLGMPLNEMIGKTMDELFPSEMAKKMVEDDRKVLKERKHAIYEEELNGRYYTTVKFPIIIDNQPEYLAGYTIDITEQKKAEDTLRNSEERLKILFNYAPVAYYLSDVNGNFIDSNIAAENLLGYNKSELIGKNFLKLKILSPSQILKAQKLLTESLPGNPTGPVEFILTRKDGTKVTVEITTYPVKIENQTLILGIFRDISDRKRTELAMKQASENWKRTFQAMHSGIALLDSNQRIMQTNLAFQKLLNAWENKLSGKHYLQLLFGDNFPKEESPFERMKITKSCETTEIEINGKTCEVLFDPIMDARNKITGAVVIINDITQRKRDEKIQQILHVITGTQMFDKSVGELLIIVRKELSKVIDTTNFFVALYQPDTQTLRKVIFEDEKDDFVEWDARKSLSGQVLKLGKPVLLNSEDEARFAKENNIELLGSPAACWLGVPLMSGEKAIGVMVVQSYIDENAYDQAAIRLLILIAHELSIIIERKKMIQDLVAAKDRAEESDRLKSAFLANMSHEIRTPMNGILGFAELLKEPKLSGEEQHMFIDIIKKSGERMLNIINDLINISKIESGQMDVYFSDTNINEQLEFLYNFFKLEAKQKNLKLVVNYPITNEQSSIKTDREKVYAILTNLIKNALKFTKKGTIEFGYEVAENELIFYIKDTGIGIPLNKQKSIFERFVQVNSGPTNVYEGAGLGLAISKAYVEMLGGKIWINSEPGKGTSFFFTLPNSLQKETVSEIDKNETLTSGIDTLEETILIVEDDETSLLYLNQILKNSNLKIIVANNGAEAVELCRYNNEIGLVLMDISLPVIDGQLAAEIIKNFKRDLPVIAQTAFALDEEKDKYSETFDDYITKPIKADELKLKIRKFLKHSKV